MNSIGKALVVLSAFLAAAYGLKCRQCAVDVFGACLFGSEVTCGPTMDTCFKAEAVFNVTDSLKLVNRGCRNSTGCSTVSTGSLLGAGYTVTSFCCNTDLCNGASSLQMSLGVGLIFATLSTFWASQ